MSLAPGTRLGVYEITALLGAGGMGEVYRANDTNLKRQVAIKVLPASVAGDAERLARFQREAEVLAALNHPNIAAIYGLEKTPGFTALVMELVEGDDLSQRIARGAIPADEALPIAKQIAEALEAAHEQGIIHRDLKPANIKVRADGTVKVLDFGLAKAMEQAPGSGLQAPGLTNLPTITTPAMTQAGMILGTAAYMSPEQARGKIVDKRADIWAFGAVLFEMLTGARAFGGEDIAETLGAVIHKEPVWSRLPASTPASLRTVLERCLHKDPRQRLRDIGDVRLALDGAFETETGSPAVAHVQPLRRHLVAGAAVSVVTALVLGLGVWRIWPQPEPRLVSYFEDVLPLEATGGDGRMAISPDGRHIAYRAGITNSGLFVRDLDTAVPRQIPGIRAPSNIFFSPDGASVGYGNGNELMRVPAAGGSPQVICKLQGPIFGSSWASDDTVFFADSIAGIFRVPASGGVPELVVPAGKGEALRNPQLLPGGDLLLFGVVKTAVGAPSEDRIVVQSLRTRVRTVLWSGGRAPRYLAPGHLVFAQGARLYAMAVDLDTLKGRGAPVPLNEALTRGLQSAERNFAVSDGGTLAVLVPSMTQSRQLALVDRDGTQHRLDVPAGAYVHPRLSPDGRQLVVATEDGGDVWVYDLASGAGLRRLTFAGRNTYPLWTPDGRSIVFQSDREGDEVVYRQIADGSGPAERLSRLSGDQRGHEPESWGPDGVLSMNVQSAAREQGVWMLRPGGSAVLFADGPLVEKHSTFSRDGRWLAYMSSTPRDINVFVQPFPSTGALYQVSTGGGRTPAWSPDGTELFYHAPATNELMVVSVMRPAAGLAFGPPRTLPIGGTIHPNSQRNFDVTPDGKQLLVVLPADDAPAVSSTRIRIVQHWFEEVRRLMPD